MKPERLQDLRDIGENEYSVCLEAFDELQRYRLLMEALKAWYDHTSGHDVGPLLNKVANTYMVLVSGTGEATEQPTGRADLPPIVPEMIPSPNAQVESPEPDMETLDAMERAGRLALVEETRKSWLGREVTTGTEFTIAPATVDLQAGHPVSTSGYIAVLPDPIADDARQAYDNRYHKVRAEVSFDAWLRAYRYFVGLDVAAVKGSDIEAMAKSYSD